MPKLAVLLCVLAPLAHAQPLTARLYGVVRDLGGAPVRRVELFLESAGDDDDDGLTLRSVSGEDGRFGFDQVPPGRGYSLRAVRAGYAEARYPAPLTLDAGAAVNGIVILMTPQGAITGRVTNPEGDPVVSAPVWALRRAFDGGVRRQVIAARTLTNDRGEYRIAHLAPGAYSVGVMDRRILYSAPGRPAEGYAAASSAVLQVPAGGEVRNVDLRLRRERVYAIRGKVATEDGTPASGTLLAAVSLDDAAVFDEATQVLRAAMGPDAAFEFPGLRPGTYLIQTLPGVRLNSGITPQLMARREVTITDRDVNDVVLITSPGVSLAGTVIVEGAGVDGLAPSLRVELEETSPLARNPPVAVAVSPEGQFRIEHAAPSAHYVNVNGLPANVYVKSLRFNGQDITHAPLELGQGGGELEIVLSVRAAGITGLVRDSQGGALPAAAVTLWPETPDTGKASRGVHTAISDQNGTFTFQSLPPGEYYLAAWESAEPGLLEYHPFLMQFAKDAVRLELGENAHAALAIPQIPVAKIEDAASQLP